MQTILRIMSLLCLLGFSHASLAATPSSITIKASKKTADAHQTTELIRRNHSVQSSSKDIFYRIEVTARTPQIPTNVVVKWIVALQDDKRRVYVGTEGMKEAMLAVGRPTTVETEDFTLESLEIRHHGLVGERGPEIYGYGVRVCDDEDHIIAEMYEPDRVEKELVELFDKSREQAGRQHRKDQHRPDRQEQPL